MVIGYYWVALVATPGDRQASVVPVVVFAVAIAFLATPALALVSFLLTLPLEALVDRFAKPENAGRYF